MKRLALVLFAWLALAVPAAAAELLVVPITTAVTAQVSPPLQMRPGPGGRGYPATAALQGTLSYGSGGLTVNAWVQTSLDGGVTWVDVANFSFTTAAARFIFNLSSATVNTTQVVPTDGTLGANSAKDGIFGTLWRVKYSSTGTYVGTTLRVDMISNGLTP